MSSSSECLRIARAFAIDAVQMGVTKLQSHSGGMHSQVAPVAPQVIAEITKTLRPKPTKRKHLSDAIKKSITKSKEIKRAAVQSMISQSVSCIESMQRDLKSLTRSKQERAEMVATAHQTVMKEILQKYVKLREEVLSNGVTDTMKALKSSQKRDTSRAKREANALRKSLTSEFKKEAEKLCDERINALERSLNSIRTAEEASQVKETAICMTYATETNESMVKERKRRLTKEMHATFMASIPRFHILL